MVVASNSEYTLANATASVSSSVSGPNKYLPPSMEGDILGGWDFKWCLPEYRAANGQLAIVSLPGGGDRHVFIHDFRI